MFDIMFPTDFGVLAVMVEKAREQQRQRNEYDTNETRERETSTSVTLGRKGQVMSHAGFITEFTPEKIMRETVLQSGENIMLEWYGNVGVYCE